MGRSAKHNIPVAMWPAVLAVVTLVCVCVPAMAGCTDLTASDTHPTATVMGTIPADLTGTLPVSTESTTTTSTVAPNPVSQGSRDYAASLGGTDRYGETLWFVIGESVKSEARAKELLEPAKAIGDTQMYFIVQLSDNFDGMRAGYWVIFEAYDHNPPDYDVDWCRRAFPEAYVKKATVMTHDPIPVR
jgi:hypothetical protein